MRIEHTFEREDHSTYKAENGELERVRLADGQVIDWGDLEVGDEIESHHSAETGGRGHVVIR